MKIFTNQEVREIVEKERGGVVTHVVSRIETRYVMPPGGYKEVANPGTEVLEIDGATYLVNAGIEDTVVKRVKEPLLFYEEASYNVTYEDWSTKTENDLHMRQDGDDLVVESERLATMPGTIRERKHTKHVGD